MSPLPIQPFYLSIYLSLSLAFFFEPHVFFPCLFLSFLAIQIYDFLCIYIESKNYTGDIYKCIYIYSVARLLFPRFPPLVLFVIDFSPVLPSPFDFLTSPLFNRLLPPPPRHHHRRRPILVHSSIRMIWMVALLSLLFYQ